MKRLKASLTPLYTAIEENSMLAAVRSGLVLAIPAIMTGAVALMLISIPIEPYQQMIKTLWNGFPLHLFQFFHAATLDIVSLIILLCIGISYEKQTLLPGRGTLPIVCLCSYLAFYARLDEAFDFSIFDSTHLFNAIAVTIVASLLYQKLYRILPGSATVYRTPSEGGMWLMEKLIAPASLTVLVFALCNTALTHYFGGTEFQTFFSDRLLGLFSRASPILDICSPGPPPSLTRE